MSQHPTASDWSAARGEKWRAQLAGMEATLAPVDEPLLRALRLDAAYRIADVGCGGGGTTLEIARRAPAGSLVRGFDVAPALIEAARARAAGGSIAFELADVTTFVPPEPFERLASRFGVMFFADPIPAFASLRRWLVPGGRFAFAVWARPDENDWFAAVREVVASTIELPAPVAGAPGPFRYGRVEELLAILREAGFSELAASDWRGTLPIGGELSPERAADFALRSFSSFGEELARAGDHALEEARRALTERFARHHGSGAVRMGARVHLVTGARPG